MRNRHPVASTTGHEQPHRLPRGRPSTRLEFWMLIFAVFVFIILAVAAMCYSPGFVWLVVHTLHETCSISAMGVAPEINGDTAVWIGDKVSIRTYHNQSATNHEVALGSCGMASSAVDQAMWSTTTKDGITSVRDCSAITKLVDRGVEIEAWISVLTADVLYKCSRGALQRGSIYPSSIATSAYKDSSHSMLWAGLKATCEDGAFAWHSEYFVQSWLVNSTSVRALDQLTGHNDVIVELRHSGDWGLASEGNFTLWSASQDGQVIGWTTMDVESIQVWVEIVRIKTPSRLTSLSVRRLPSPPSPFTSVQSSSTFMVWTGSASGYVSTCMCNTADKTDLQPGRIYTGAPVLSLALAPGTGAHADSGNADVVSDDDSENDDVVSDHNDDHHSRLQELAADKTRQSAVNKDRIQQPTMANDETMYEGTPYVLVVGLRNGVVNLYSNESRLLASFTAARERIFSMLVTAPSRLPNGAFYVWVGSKGGSFLNQGSVRGWKCVFDHQT